MGGQANFLGSGGIPPVPPLTLGKTLRQAPTMLHVSDKLFIYQ